MVLSWYFRGLALSSGSGIRDNLRFIDAAWDESSMNFTCMELFLETGLGIGGLRLFRFTLGLT